MRVADVLSLSTRMFRTRALRTGLTILGVSVGIGTIVFLVSLGFGLQQVLLERITTDDSLLSLDLFPPEAGILPINATALEKMSKTPNVASVVPVAIYGGQLELTGSVTDTSITVTEPEYFALTGLSPTQGKLYAKEDATRIVITKTIADIYELTQDAAINKELQLTLFYETAVDTKSGPHIVQSEAKKSVIIAGIVEGDTPALYMSSKVFPDIQPSEYAQAKVRVTSSEVLDSVRDVFLQEGYTVLALSDVVAQANKVFNVVQIVLVIFGLAALVVSAIGMFNTMTIAFLERTQEIGIMRSIGASEQDVFSLFLIESALMGFLGGVGGVLIGVIGQTVVNLGLDLLARSLGGQPIDIFATPFWFVLTVVIFSSGVGFLTGLLPGRRASKLNPLEALRYK